MVPRNSGAFHASGRIILLRPVDLRRLPTCTALHRTISCRTVAYGLYAIYAVSVVNPRSALCLLFAEFEARFIRDCAGTFHLSYLRPPRLVSDVRLVGDTRRAPSLHCRDTRTKKHTTSAMHDMSTLALPPPPSSFPRTCVPGVVFVLQYGAMLLQGLQELFNHCNSGPTEPSFTMCTCYQRWLAHFAV